MEHPNPPTVYLINRGLTDEQIEQLKDYLAITPLAAVLVTKLSDLDYARKITGEHAAVLSRPIAVIGDFQADFGELGDSTKWHLLSRFKQ